MRNTLPLLGLVTLSAAWLQAGTVFTRPTASPIWQDGLFVGDGATGAIGSAPAGLEWVINRNDIFDSRVGTCDYLSHDEVMAVVATNAGHSVEFLGSVERKRTKLPATIGDKLTLTLTAAILRMRFWPGVGWSMPATPETRQSVDTRTGELTMTMTNPLRTIETTSFIERGRDVMAISVASSPAVGLSSWIELTRPDDIRFTGLPFAWTNEADVVAFSQKLPGGETYAVAMTAPEGALTAAQTARIRTKGPTMLLLAVRTTRDAADPVNAAISAVRLAMRDGFAAVRTDNRSWWRRFWSRGAEARFESAPEIDTQWNYALYALASQYGRAPMPGLNGLFYGPLGGLDGGVIYNCYVHDQNVQIPMMPFFPLNHADFIEPFVATYENALPELKRRTEEYFHAKGAYLPLNMNHDGKEHPIGDYRYTFCGGAYSGLVLAQAWWYTHDEAILRRIYPLLKEFIRFYVSTAKRRADGTYQFLWSVPPEIFTGSTDDTATIACLKPCLEVAVEAARRFGTDDAECKIWQDVLAHYPTCARQSEGGWWCGPDVPDDHYMYGGHLFYPFFPAENEPNAELAKKTLDYTWKYGVDVAWSTNPPHPDHDWTALYTGMAVTRAYGGLRGWQAVMDFYRFFAKPNGHFSHNPIVLTNLTKAEIAANLARAPKVMRRWCDGSVRSVSRQGPDDLTQNSSAKALVAPVIEGGASFLLLSSEALCQSWGGEIRIFPSVPTNFTGSFTNFRVRGGYTVSAAMKNGKVVDFDLQGAGKGAKIKVTCPTDPDFVQLPGEPAWKAPVGQNPFPDALSAFVFRNWSLVPAETLAATVGATAEQIRAIAAEMGLDPTAKVPAAWKRSGYVTILRRNWQLLPYSQILSVVGMTRKELRHALMYDDFLLTKMGSDKPNAPRIVYDAKEVARLRPARLALKAALEDEGVRIADTTEEPRFDFMRQLAELPRGEAVKAKSNGRFQTKLIFPYCADYGDVLADPDAASCSEGLIARLAESGVNALWFHVILAQLSTDPNYPEWSVDAPRRRATLRKLVDRAARHGVKIFLYINEPRSQPGSFFEKPGRAGMRGAVEPRGAGYYAMCTEDPATLAWLRGCLTSLFTDVKGLGGVFTITMSETMTHCASAFANAQKTCPKCAGKPYEYFIAKVNRAIVDGVRGGNPDAAVWFYDVGWEVDKTDERVIPLLPKEGSLLVWSEKKLAFEQAGKTRHVTEYSISHPGPSPKTSRLWQLGAKAGLGGVAKLQVNCSWELSAVPYLPTMDLVAEHAVNLASSPVQSVMLSWSQGGYPSPNLKLFDAFRRGDTTEAVLDRVAQAIYGPAASAVRRAWTAYSEAFRNYPIEWQTVYYSPVQMGAANLLYADKTDYKATMINTPYDDFRAWSDGYGDNREGWIEQMRKCAEGFARGDALWREVAAQTSGEAHSEAVAEAGIFETATLTLRSVVDQAEFIRARDRGDRREMVRRAEAELKTAKRMLALVRADSRLGYESSNRYIYVPNDFLEKILNCRAIIAAESRPLFVVNEDNDHFFKCERSQINEKGLTDYIDYVCRGKVTHLVFCVNGQRASYDSATWEPIWAGLGEAARPGFSTWPDGTHDRWALHAKALFDAGIDPYAVWIAACRAKGVSPWLSMRMNDVHFCTETNFFRNTSWYKSHPEYRLDPSGKNGDWLMNQLDFAHPEVRAYELAQVREVAARWPADGMELDWMRFGNVFKPSEAVKNAPILDEFMREASAAIRATGKRVSVRVPPLLSACAERGFNVIGWAKEGLVDVILPAPFIWNEPLLPVAEWKAALAGLPVRLVPDLGCELRGVKRENVAEGYRDEAEKFMNEGADGCCLFNLPYKSNSLYSTDNAGKPWCDKKDIAADLYTNGLCRRTKL